MSAVPVGTRVTRKRSPRLRLVLVVAATMLAAACTVPQPSRTPAPHSTTGSPTPSPTLFTGPGYVMAMPVGSYSVAGVGEWNEGVSPARRVAGFDTFQTPGGGPWIVIGRRPVSDGASLDQWVEHMRKTRTISYPSSVCVSPETRSVASLGGEAAIVLSFHCPVDGPLALATQVLTMHRGSGYAAMCYDEDPPRGALTEFQRACLSLLEGFAFST